MHDKMFQTETNRIRPSEHYLVSAKEVLRDLIHTTSGIDGGISRLY